MQAAIHQQHPFVNLLYYSCVGVLVMFFLHPIFLLTAIFLLMILNILHGNIERMKKSSLYFFLMGAIIILLNPIFVRRGATILFYFRHNPVTLEAVIYGLVMALLLISILFLFLSFNHVIHGRKFMYLFGKVWPQLALLVMLTIRFVPLFLRRWREIYDVQKVKHYSMSNGPIKARAKTGMLYMQKLLTWSLEEALQSAESMKARGFGQKRRAVYQAYTMTGRDWGVTFALLSLTILGIVGAKQKHGVLAIYPELGSFAFTMSDLFFYMLFFIIVSFPLILEGAEQIRWRLSR